MNICNIKEYYYHIKKRICLTVVLTLFIHNSFTQTKLDYRNNNYRNTIKNTEYIKAGTTGKGKQQKKALKHIRKGDMYVYKCDFRSAIDQYNEALFYDPENAALNYKIGKCYLNSGRKCVSFRFLEEAYKLDADVFPDILYLLGQSYQLNSKYSTAIKTYDKYKRTLSDNSSLNKEIQKRIDECTIAKKLIRKPVNVKIENLDVINSAYPDFNSVLNADGTTMILSSRRENTTKGKKDHLDLKYFDDIYISNHYDNIWSTPGNTGKPLNSRTHDAAVGLTPNGVRLVIYKDKNNGDLYYSEKDWNNNWTKPKSLSKRVNTRYRETSASFSSDGKTLFFVSDRKGGIGGKDIYMIKVNRFGRCYGKAVNMGPVINSPYDEEGVFIHPNSKMLFFSSKNKSMGGYDIFKSEFVDNEWTEPVNLGHPVNGPDDDLYYSVSADGKNAYYSSVRPEGDGALDIYKIIYLKETEIEDNTFGTTNTDELIVLSTDLIVVKGTVLNERTKPTNAKIEIVDNETFKIVTIGESDIETGEYHITLFGGHNYMIAISKRGYLFHSENIDVTKKSELQEIVVDIQLQKLNAGSKIVLNNIFFETGRAILTPESTSELKGIIKLMNDNPKLKIEISGHTDNVGSAETNNRLSTQRAKAVVDYLIRNGIVPDMLEYKGYGYSMPIAPNDTEGGRRKNRRTEFKILGK